MPSMIAQASPAYEMKPSEPHQTATSSPTTASKLKLKLLVDQHSNQVLFAEADKDVVDFLFGLLKLPLGSVARLLSNYRILSCIDMLCDSVQSLDDAYFIEPTEDRRALLNPQIFSSTLSLLENEMSLAPPAKKYYRCTGDDCRAGCHPPTVCRGNFGHVTDVFGTRCPACRQEMTVEMKFVAGEAASKLEKARAEAGGGYVLGVVTYMVMDDLSVMPMSTTSAITLLNKLHIKDVSSLCEWTVELGTEEGLELLKASLRSTTVLTDVFLGDSKSGVPGDCPAKI